MGAFSLNGGTQNSLGTAHPLNGFALASSFRSQYRSIFMLTQSAAATPEYSTDNGSFSGTQAEQTIVLQPSTSSTPQPPVGARKSFAIGTLGNACPRPSGTTHSFCIKIPNSGSIDPTVLSNYVASGIQDVRFGPTPNQIDADCTTPHFHYDDQDSLIASLASKGINVLFTFDVAGPPGCGIPMNPPPRPWYKTTALYAQYCGQVAGHIATSNPNIHDVEIGTNEPNFKSNGGQFPADGVAMAGYLKACYGAIKAADPSLRVFAPGVATDGTDTGFLTYVHNLYLNGCKTHVCWDVITLHIYSWAANPQDPYVPGDVSLGHNESKQTWTLYKDLQAQAVAEGDAKPPVGITETGFSSCGGGISESLKAYRTSVYLNQLLADPTVVQTIVSDITQNETPNSGGFSCIWSENNDGTAGEPTFPVIQAFTAAIKRAP